MKKKKFPIGARVRIIGQSSGLIGTIIAVPHHPNTWYKVRIDGSEKCATFRASSLSSIEEEGVTNNTNVVKEEAKKRVRVQTAVDGDGNIAEQRRSTSGRPKRQRNKPTEFVASPYSEKKIQQWEERGKNLGHGSDSPSRRVRNNRKMSRNGSSEDKKVERCVASSSPISRKAQHWREMLVKGALVLIEETANVQSRVPWIVGCIGVISDAPTHPNSWFKVRFPTSVDEKTNVFQKNKGGVEIKFQKTAIVVVEEGTKPRKDLPFEMLKSYSKSGKRNVGRVEASSGKSDVATKSGARSTAEVGEETALDASKLSELKTQQGEESVDIEKFPYLSTVSPDKWIGITIMIKGGRHNGITAEVSGAGNGWVQLIPHDKSVTNVVAKRAQELVVIPSEYAVANGRRKTFIQGEGERGKRMASRGERNQSSGDGSLDEARSSSNVTNTSKRSRRSNYSKDSRAKRARTQLEVSSNRVGSSSTRRNSKTLINELVLLSDGRRGTVVGSGHGFFNIIIENSEDGVSEIVKRKEDFKVISEDMSLNSSGIKEVRSSRSSRKVAEKAKRVSKEKERKEHELTKRKTSGRTDLQRNSSSGSSRSASARTYNPYSTVYASDKAKQRRRNYRRNLLDARREHARQYVEKWQKKIRLPSGGKRPSFQLWLDELEQDQEDMDTDLVAEANEYHGDAVDLVKVRTCSLCGAEMGLDWKFCWGYGCPARSVYLQSNANKRNSNFNTDLLLQYEENARVVWLGDEGGLGQGEHLHTDLSDLAFRWNAWTRQPSNVNKHPDIQASIKLISMGQRKITAIDRCNLMRQGRLAIHNSREQEFMRREAKERELLARRQEEELSRRRERLKREQQYREQRRREEHELEVERQERIRKRNLKGKGGVIA